MQNRYRRIHPARSVISMGLPETPGKVLGALWIIMEIIVGVVTALFALDWLLDVLS